MLRHGLTRIHTPAAERPWPNSPKEVGDVCAQGNYVVVKYTAEPATSDELDRVLNLNESVIRTKILRKG